MYRFRNTLAKLLILTLALTGVFAGLGFSAQPAQAATCYQYHTVQPGEYLAQIARQYGADWRTLAEINNLSNPNLIFAGQKLCVDASGVIIPDTGSRDSDAPTIEILGAVRDDEVTILAYNFPARAELDILLDEIGTRAVDGIWVSTVTTNSRGAVEATVDIPRSLRGDSLIAIRVESVRSSHFSYNWFYNQDFETDRGGPDYDDDSRVGVGELSLGESVDVFKGKAGVFMPSSNYNGSIVLTRHEVDRKSAPGLSFQQDLLDVQVLDSDGDPFERVFGLNYVYFNLNWLTRRALDRGELDIVHFDPATQDWESCEVQVLVDTVNEPYGRLACVVESFGLYGLAIQR